jgi:CheY-like chemotaxis protein
MTTILVVEDDPVIRENVTQLLGNQGYEIGQATDGVQALEMLKRRKFDLLLSDIVMPRMDGLTLIQHVRSSWPQTHIMVMTAYFQSASDTGFSVAGAEEFIRKPFLLDDLLSKVERVLQQPKTA